MQWALVRGADGIRTGLEDNIRLTSVRLAASNAELVRIAVDEIVRSGREPATPAQARKALGLAV